jgi:hypothetical protein
MTHLGELSSKKTGKQTHRSSRKSRSVANLFGNRLNMVNNKTKARVRVGACDLVCAIWNYHNVVVFDIS